MMDIAAKNRQIANSYYNLGLEKADRCQKSFGSDLL